MKRRRGSVRKKSVPPVLFLIILFAFLVLIVITSLFFNFSKSPSNIRPLLYEEIYSSHTDLNKRIRNIDYAIYESLYRCGIEEKDIFFLNVQPRHQNGYVWDFSELLIQCQDRNSALNLYKAISRYLAALGNGIRYRKDKESEGKILCHVFAKDVYTHKIILSVDSYRTSTKDVRPKIAIIIDDLGYDLDTDLLFFQLDLPLVYSVLPYGPFTKSIVKMANKRGCELILHLPMEARNYPFVEAGPGGLYLSMEEHEIKKVLSQDLRQIPGVSGVNNHMGSSFTENREKTLVVLKELKKMGLYFVDSRTTANTVALDLARKMGLPAARRRVFLDNNTSPKALKIQMERLLNMARHRGAAIGIAHPYRETYELLRKYRSKIKAEFQIVPVSELVM